MTQQPVRTTKMSRIQGTLIHLAISISVFATLIGILLTKWYPGVFFKTDGGWEGLQIVILVDLVLGPLLTFVVFDPKKVLSKLRFDLFCIGTLQLLALIYGANLLHSQRLVAITLWEGTLYPLNMDIIKYQKVEPKSIEKFYDQNVPPVIQVLRPVGDDARRHFLNLMMNEGVQPWNMTYIFTEHKGYDEIFKNKINPKSIEAHESGKSLLDKFLKKHGGTADDYSFMSYMGEYKEILLAFNKEGKRVGYLDLPYSDIRKMEEDLKKPNLAIQPSKKSD